MGVYRIPHALEQKAGAEPVRGELQLLISDLTRPNGIAFSPDEKYLYVDDSERKIWMRYRVQTDGTLTEAKLLYDASSDKRPGGPDGMKVDSAGNIYSSGPGGVWIFSAEGKAAGDYCRAGASCESGVGWGGSQDALHCGEQQPLSGASEDCGCASGSRALNKPGGQVTRARYA